MSFAHLQNIYHIIYAKLFKFFKNYNIFFCKIDIEKLFFSIIKKG